MNKVWRVEFRLHAWVFAASIVVVGALGILRLLWSSTGTDILEQLSTMILWTVLVGYVGGSLYSFFYFGRDLWLHLSETPESVVCQRRAVVLGVYLYALFLVSFLLHASRLAHDSQHFAVRVVVYYLVAKVVSIAAFLGVALAILGITKIIGNKVLAVFMGVVLFVGVAVGQGFLLWALRGSSSNSWALGISNDFHAVSTYTNIVPFVIGDSHSVTLGSSIPYLSIIVNAVVGVVAWGLWRLIVGIRRFDFYER